MVVSDCEDSLTKLNTELNRSMVLMDTNNKMEKSPKIKSKIRKSITINTTTTTPSSSSSIVSSTPSKINEARKSILKNTRRTIGENLLNEEQNEIEQKLPEKISIIPTMFEKPKQLERRPLTLDEYIRNDSLIVDPTASSFIINEIDEDDELWVFDIPKTINPRELKGQTFYFGDRTKFKIGNERYLAVSNDNTDCFTCVMGTGRENKRFKTVNIKPSGTIVVRKKLSTVGNHFSINDDDEELNATVPFPDNLKIRHPLMGVENNGKKMKKLSPIKSRIKKRKSESSD